MKSLSDTEKKILRLLQADASLSVQAIAERIHLSVTPCWKRIKRLEAEGFIAKRVALLDAEQVGIPISVFVSIQTQQHDRTWYCLLCEKITAFDEVMELYRMSGDTDYLMRVQVSSIQAFDQFYQKLVQSVEGISNVTSSFALEQIKYTTALPL